MDQVALDADRLLGGTPDSGFILDESSLPKKGKKSVGVARQWCGRIGKVDNCQTGVYASLVHGVAATIIACQLYLPKEWTDDRNRCKAAGVPEDVIFQTKSQLALDIVHHSRSIGTSQDESAELYIFHNRPHAGAGYIPVGQRLLPFDEEWRYSLVKRPWPTGCLPEVMGSDLATLRVFIGEYLFVSLFRACAESLASENASRLAAMQRADKNINELLEELKGTFHRLRQSGIDEELFDVIFGFEAFRSFSHPDTQRDICLPEQEAANHAIPLPRKIRSACFNLLQSFAPHETG
jgi:hypothetical protein